MNVDTYKGIDYKALHDSEPYKIHDSVWTIVTQFRRCKCSKIYCVIDEDIYFSNGGFTRVSWYGVVWGRHAIKTRSGAVNLVFERSPPPVQADLKSKTEVPFDSEMERSEVWFFSLSV